MLDEPVEETDDLDVLTVNREWLNNVEQQLKWIIEQLKVLLRSIDLDD